jgi:hypothetical protein
LDYLSEKVQVVVNENKQLKKTANRLISHNDYLAENIENSINYTKYIAENLDKNIGYSEYIAENLDKNIGYSEYLAENLDSNIEYSEYIKENLNKSIRYGNYLAKNLDKNIGYSEYIAESLDKSIEYGEYLAENLDNTICYSEYISENLQDNIAYADYIAENLDKNIEYSGVISKKLNGSKLFESKGKKFIPTLEDVGFEEIPEDDKFNFDDEDEFNGSDEDLDSEILDDEESELSLDSEILDNTEEILDNEEEIKDELSDINTLSDEQEIIDGEIVGNDEFITGTENDSELTKKIDKLIEEAKKRKVSETSDLHFLKFLNKSQVDSYYNLANDEQEKVKLYINEKSYFSNKEVLNLIAEAVSLDKETLEDRVLRLMPNSIKSTWNSLNESYKKSILSQAYLYPELDTESKVENFWYTRNFRKNESTKKLVNHDSLIREDKLSENQFNSIIEKFKSLK